MGLEVATFISQLVATNPTGADDYATADDHLRLVKAVLQAQFPNFGASAVTPTEAELNFVDGVTAAIQGQIDGKAPTAHSHTSGEISALDVSDITTGIFAAAFIPNLNASKINAGIFAAGRIPTHTGDVTGQTALTIAADAVTYAKMQNVTGTDRFLGRDSAGAGIVEELTAAVARSILGIEAGATADQSNTEIKTAYEANADTNAFDDAEQTKLGAISGTNTGDEPAASTTVQGIVERATQAEVDTGTDTTRYVSPATLAGTGLTILRAVKTADESVTSSAVLQDDNHLTLTLVSGKYYEVRMYLHIDTGASATPGIRFAFTTPGASTGSFGIVAPQMGSSPATANDLGGGNASWGATQTMALSANGDRAMLLYGTILAAASGAFTLRWAQNTSNATPTTVKKHSSLTALEIQ